MMLERFDPYSERDQDASDNHEEWENEDIDELMSEELVVELDFDIEAMEIARRNELAGIDEYYGNYSDKRFLDSVDEEEEEDDTTNINEGIAVEAPSAQRTS